MSHEGLLFGSQLMSTAWLISLSQSGIFLFTDSIAWKISRWKEYHRLGMLINEF